MTHFEDGPAMGETLQLDRVPTMLRVVIDLQGKVDALNNPEDEPRHDEVVVAYVMSTDPTGRAHIDGRRNGKRFSQWMTFGAVYRMAKVQPLRHECREAEAWQQWATANHKNA